MIARFTIEGRLLKMRLALRPLTARVARKQRQFGFTQSQGLIIGVIVPVYLEFTGCATVMFPHSTSILQLLFE